MNQRFPVAKITRSDRFREVEIGKVDGVRTVIEVVDEAMTALGGMPLLGRVNSKVGLIKALAARINDTRTRNRVDHTDEAIILQRASQIASGFADGNDCDWLRRDPAVLLLLDRDPETGRPGVSQETASKFEKNAINASNLKHVNEIFVDHYLEQQSKSPKEVVLDCDGTIIKTYGAQEGAVYRGGKYKHEMYFPLSIFCGDWLLATILRRGDQSEAKTILAQLKIIVAKLRARWRGIRIKVRMDSAFCSPALVEWLKQNKISYELALRTTSCLKDYSKWFVEESRELFVKRFGEPRFIGKDGKSEAQAEHARIRGLATEKRMEEEENWKQRRVRVVGEFCYKPEKWKKFLQWHEWERVICRCDFTDKGSDVKYVLVSQQRGVPKRLYEDSYCQRGASEQCIGRFKQIGRRLSAQEFHANQFRLNLYGIAYMLLLHLRKFVKPDLRKADAHTLQKNLIVMPMIIHRTAKKRVIQISAKHTNRATFLDTWRRLTA